MSLKRPPSPESNNNHVRQLKRFKLHSIIEELKNEEANLVLLKKLRSSQQLLTRTNNNSTRLPTPSTNSFLPQQSIPIVTHKSTKISSNHSIDERKTHAKLALRKQLERDLLNIPLPKPSLQNIHFIPNGTSLEFQPILGLEDVVQCLNKLQNDHHRFPNHIQLVDPYICDQCGTDFTIRWWKHLNIKSLNIVCDRCKKQIIRKTSKSEHSTLLKNVFLSAMEQENTIEKQFHTLIKQQQKDSSQSFNTHQIQSRRHLPVTNYQHQKLKLSLPQNLVSKTKTIIKQQQHIISSSRSKFPPNLDLRNSFLSSNFVRSTTNKRRAFPTVQLK